MHSIVHYNHLLAKTRWLAALTGLKPKFFTITLYSAAQIGDLFLSPMLASGSHTFWGIMRQLTLYSNLFLFIHEWNCSFLFHFGDCYNFFESECMKNSEIVRKVNTLHWLWWMALATFNEAEKINVRSRKTKHSDIFKINLSNFSAKFSWWIAWNSPVQITWIS